MRLKIALILLTGAMALMLASAKTAQAVEAEGGGNMVSFRGGWARLTSDRANELFTDVHGTGQALGVSGNNDGKNGYYVGGALDLLLSHDVWGMVQHTWALGEIGVEFKRFNSRSTINTQNLGIAGSACGDPALCARNVTPTKEQITMLTVDIAPKIKFLEGSAVRPWIIPVGLDFNVISPPSNATTVLDIGVQFGAGAEYRLYKAFVLGLDGRFHLSSGQTGTTNNFGTVGGYVGISF